MRPKYHILCLLALALVTGMAHAAPPVVVSLSPTNSASQVQPDTDMVATFDQVSSLVDGGKVIVTNLTDGTATAITLPDSRVSIAGDTNLTISLDSYLTVFGDTYAVMVDGSSVTNAAGEYFAGINDTTTWRFSSTTNGNWALVAYWPLNDGTNGQTVTTADDVIDDPGHPATDGTEGGSAVSKWVYDSEKDKIVFYTEDNSRLVAGTMGIEAGVDLTWQTWIKTIDNNTTVFLGTRDGSYLRFNPTKVDGSWGVSWDFAPDVNDDNWHHMVLRRSHGTWTVWIDGSQASGSDYENGANNTKFEIGGSGKYNADFYGYMSDAAIWTEALTPARIQQLADGHDVIMDITPPVIGSLSPTNNATGVGVGDNLIVTFDDVIVTNAGDITITNLTDSTGFVITVPGIDPDGAVSVSSSNLIINPATVLDPNDTYAVLMDIGTVENEYGYDAVGIDDTTTWRFTTGAADSDPPVLSSLDPTNNATGVPVASNLVATFNENIVLVNGGVITITNLTDGTGTDITVPDAQLSVLNEQLTINPATDLDYGDLYAVLIDAAAIDDSSGNSFAGILNTTTWRFTTDTRPAVVALDPADDSSGATTSTNLSMTFDRDVVALAGGVITITNITDGTAKTLVLQDDAPATPGIQDNRLTISGSNVSIDARSNLEHGDQYAIQIDTSSFQDLFGQGYLGITNTTTWNFSTDTDPNANLTAYWPLTDGTNGETVASTGGADDIIDDPSHDATDGVETGTGNSWVYDGERDRIVLRTVEGGRLYVGNTQMNMDFTWSLWAKGIGGDTGCLMGTRDGNYTRLYLTTVSGGYLNFDFPDFNNDEWHHLALTRKDNLFTVYVDGTNQASKTQAADDNNMKLELGGTSKYASDLNGYMSDVAIWLEALTEQRIQDLANGTEVIPSGSGSVFMFK